MARVESVRGESPHPGWRFCEYHYGAVHGWLEEASNRSAMVAAGFDSFERAQALLAGHAEPAAVRYEGLMVLDATALQAQEAARRDYANGEGEES